MAWIAVIAALFASPAETAEASWNCRNQLEVWCTVDSCAAADGNVFTPMDITASPTGALSICAYTGCWESAAELTLSNGRWLWTTDNAVFSTAPQDVDGVRATLLIVEGDGVGFVRVGSFATPLLCGRKPAN